MIVAEALEKRYGGKPALFPLDLVVAEGETFGLAGPNGAGKTTTLGLFATLLAPTSGRVTVAGFDTAKEPMAVRRELGYVPETTGVYPDMRVEEYLAFFAAVHGIRGRAARRAVGDVLELTDLESRRNDLAETLSRGLRQRLAVARVLLHDPSVILLDEPASGLDPRARIELRSLLKELRRMAKTVVISSHILSDLADVCVTLGVLDGGRLLFRGTAAELAAHARPWTVARFGVTENIPGACERLLADPRVLSVEEVDGLREARLVDGEMDVSFIADILARGGFQLTHLSEAAPDLEEAFLRLTGDAPAQ